MLFIFNVPENEEQTSEQKTSGREVVGIKPQNTRATLEMQALIQFPKHLSHYLSTV